jgi:hypothetical protein
MGLPTSSSNPISSKPQHFHDAPLFVWKLHAGACIRESIKAAREEMMYVAKLSQIQTTVAAATFIKQIDS